MLLEGSSEAAPCRTVAVNTGRRDCQKVQENPMRMETPSPENMAQL